MNIFNFDNLSNMVVRPMRQKYRKNDLERIDLNINGKKHFRHDFRITINQTQFLECSLFSEFPYQSIQQIKRCMIYLHCNTGCRIEGLSYVYALLNENIPALLFDFRGSGLSSGQYISMGYYESQDVEIVINYLREINKNIQIGLWGRSMGSVAAIHYAARNNNVVVAILDSPFVSLENMMVKIGKNNTILPGFLVSLFFSFLNPYIFEKAGFYIQDIDNLQTLKHVKIPLLFVTSTKDKIVGTQQVQTLYKSYSEQKQIIFITKDHHEVREKGTIQKIVAIGKVYFQGLCSQSGLGDNLRNRRLAHQKQSIKQMRNK